VLYGDRGEVLATALAAVTLRIPIAHLQGGDVSGNVDEVMRHAVTKLAHLHFPSTESSCRRILAMGEEPWRVLTVGDNHVDLIVAGEYTDAATIRERFRISAGERPIVVLVHPETTRRRDGCADMTRLLEAAVAERRRTVVVYPCSDHGYEDIIRAIHTFEGRPGLSIHKNIDAPDFWGLLAVAGVMIGNSSAGLIETPYFRIPAINVGERQKGREHADNVIHCDYEPEDLRAALARALRDSEFERVVHTCAQPFGDGFAWRRIVERLKSVELGAALLDKRLVA
jgi:UDP-hydrolysing UDP-N-acetyl-D-glucosamine 2-epimerase